MVFGQVTGQGVERIDRIITAMALMSGLYYMVLHVPLHNSIFIRRKFAVRAPMKSPSLCHAVDRFVSVILKRRRRWMSLYDVPHQKVVGCALVITITAKEIFLSSSTRSFIPLFGLKREREKPIE